MKINMSPKCAAQQALPLLEGGKGNGDGWFQDSRGRLQSRTALTVPEWPPTADSLFSALPCHLYFKECEIKCGERPGPVSTIPTVRINISITTKVRNVTAQYLSTKIDLVDKNNHYSFLPLFKSRRRKASAIK